MSLLSIAAIDLGTQSAYEQASDGNHLTERAGFTRDDGSRGDAADVLLHYRG